MKTSSIFDLNLIIANFSILDGEFLNLTNFQWGIILSLFILIFGFFVFYLYNADFRVYVLHYAWIFLFLLTWYFIVLQTLSSSFSYYICIFNAHMINISYGLEFDILSLSFVILTALLFVICILLVWNVYYKLAELLMLLFLVKIFLLNLFCVTDFILFYVFFEVILIPMFLLIGIWGSRQRKVYAAYQFFIYTLLGSLFMLGSLLWLHSHTGTTDIRALSFISLTLSRQVVLWLALFVAIAVKVPMMPIHLWLPEAHVEAPTVGSVLLAGILLKLGTYAIVRFLFPIFPESSMYFAPFIMALAVCAVIYSSLTTLMQVDMKKIVAYSSVAHMNFVILGLFTFNFPGFIGAVILMLSHGIVSSALFICVGVLYERYKSRLLVYMGGLARIMPLFTFMFFGFTLGNMAFPGTFSFIGEFLILLGLFFKNSSIGVLAGLSVIFSAGYSLILYSHTMNGSLRSFVIKYYSDIVNRELFILSVLFILMVWFGVAPSVLITSFEIYCPSVCDLAFFV